MAGELNRQSEEAFAQFYGKYVALVYKVCYVYLKNAADAEDATQSVFYKYLRAEAEFQDDGHEKAWLVTTAKNCCLDILKSGWKRKRIDLETLTEPISEETDYRAEGLLEKLFALPEKYRVVLYLHYIEGYSTKEIARFLDRSEGTIRSQLLRGRKKLKQDLEDECDG